MSQEGAENPLFKKVLDSQRAFAERACQWQNDYSVDFKMAYNHYFGRKARGGEEGLMPSVTRGHPAQCVSRCLHALRGCARRPRSSFHANSCFSSTGSAPGSASLRLAASCCSRC
jgi:hypothetical protein